jgi:uncharacterized protein
VPPKTSRKPKPKPTKAKASRRRELVLLDTGPIVGLYNENDEWHKRCEEFFGQENRYDYLLTHAVLCEVIFHIQKDKHAKAASEAVLSFLKLVEDNVLRLHEHNAGFISRIKSLRSKYMDKKLDVADLSLVLAAEDCQIQKIVTIDRKDFSFLTFKKSGTNKPVAFTIILPEV